MNKPLVALLLALAAGCSTGTAAVRADGTVDLSKVTLHVGDQKAGIQALLQAAGELRGVKYKITWSQFTSGPPLLEAVNADGVDIGSVGNTPPIFAVAAKAKVAIVAAGDQTLAGQAIVVPKNSSIRSVADLKGKRIALAKGSSAHALLLSVLTKAGLGFGDIQPDYLQPADALSAFQSGKVDAWSIWDPYTAQAQAQTGARILLDATGYSNGYSFEVASDKALADKAKAAALRDYLARVGRAYLWAGRNQQAWAATWAKQIGLPLPVAEVATRRRVTRPIRLDATVIGSEQQLADAFAGTKLIPGPIRFGDFVDTRFNDIVPGASS
jgi:sulfonate transport system substrate-binding protein